MILEYIGSPNRLEAKTLPRELGLFRVRSHRGVLIEDSTSCSICPMIGSLSPDRFAPYLRAMNGNINDALRLYTANVELSEALYPTLHILEIALRSRMGAVLEREHGPQWYLGTRSLTFGTYENKMIQKALTDLSKRHKTATSGRMTAELMLGFWVILISKPYERILWQKHLPQVFPDAPVGTNFVRLLPQLRKELKAIKELRNRVSHHEPIWYRPGLASDHADACRLIDWLCTDATVWHRSIDRFSSILNKVMPDITVGIPRL
jgi:Abi-like protein